MFGRGLRLPEGAVGEVDEEMSTEVAGSLGKEDVVTKGVSMRQVA